MHSRGVLLKRDACRVGVHVTPTVALDGVIDPSVSSSFTKDDWTKYLDEKVLG